MSEFGNVAFDPKTLAILEGVSDAPPYASANGKNGRRHEVDFEDAPVRVEVYASEETVEIFVEADFETQAEEHRRFAILNIPRHLFSEAAGKAAQRASKKE